MYSQKNCVAVWVPHSFVVVFMYAQRPHL